MYKGKRVLVTGGTGLIGRPLVSMLIEAGANVKIVSLDEPIDIPKNVEFVKGDLREGVFCRKVVEKIDFVFHLAGVKGSIGIGRKQGASFFVNYLLINTNMMEAARLAGVERYLFASSICVYPPAEIFVEQNAWNGPPQQGDSYAGWAKRMGELQAEAYKEQYGWDKIAIVRPVNTYGPYDDFNPKTALVIPALLRRVLDGEDPLIVWGDGSAVRDFVFSGDVARGMLLALEKYACCDPINLGSGSGFSIKEIVRMILEVTGKSPKIVWDKEKPSGIKFRVADISKAREKIGFVPVVSLKEGLKETLNWYLKNKDVIDKKYNVFTKECTSNNLVG